MIKSLESVSFSICAPMVNRALYGDDREGADRDGNRFLFSVARDTISARRTHEDLIRSEFLIWSRRTPGTKPFAVITRDYVLDRGYTPTRVSLLWIQTQMIVWERSGSSLRAPVARGRVKRQRARRKDAYSVSAISHTSSNLYSVMHTNIHTSAPIVDAILSLILSFSLSLSLSTSLRRCISHDWSFAPQTIVSLTTGMRLRFMVKRQQVNDLRLRTIDF